MPINLDRLKTGGAFQGALAQHALPMPPPGRELAAGERVGAFRIEREISRGGMGIVYLAERADGEFTQRVALKWMSGARDREVAEALFRRERNILAGLEHPGIARLIDGGRGADDMLWFAMEYVEGDAIDQWCDRQRAGPTQRIRLVIELTQALGFAHQRLLIHRDIKPANVLVDRDGRTRLLDFGIARLADQRELGGGGALTPGFASPEQWAQGEVTVASDVYQLGLLLAVLLELLPRAAPGSHVTRAAGDGPLLAEPAALAPAWLARLPRDLAAIVARATALAPEQRYGSAAALGDDLLRYLERRPVAARRGGALYRSVCLLRRHPLAAAAAMLSMLALLGLGWRVMAERDLARAEAVRAQAEAERSRAALDFMKQLLNWAAPNMHRGESVTVAAALARGVEQLGETLKDQPRLRAELLVLFGDVYAHRREPERAVPVLQAAYALQEQLPNIDAFEHAFTGTRLANMMGSEQRERSMALFRRSIAAMRGRDDVESARLRVASQRFLAGQLFQSDQPLQARRTIEAALADARASLPPDDNELPNVLREYAAYLGALGDIEASTRLRRESYELALRVHGPDHPTVSDSAMALALSLVMLGTLDEAGELLARDRAMRLRLWGERSANVAALLHVEALWNFHGGRSVAALAKLDESQAIAIAAGEAGLTLRTRLHATRAAVLRQRGELAEAERELRLALDPAVRSRSGARDFGQYRTELARVLREQQRYEEIPAPLAEAEREMAVLPPLHIRRGQWLLEKAHLARHQGQLEAARIDLTESLRILRAVPAQVARDPLLAEALALERDLQRAPGSGRSGGGRR